MAIFPSARWMPIPETWTQPRITPTQVILHSAVDAPGPTSLYGFFSRADVKVETHFWVDFNGGIEQYVDTEIRADGNYKANVRAISVETEDDGQPDQRPWTQAQVDALARLIAWAHRTHGIPIRICPAWDQPGVGWHAMWGSPSPWTPVGRTCPGRVRIQQIPQVLALARSHAGTPRPAVLQPSPRTTTDEEDEVPRIIDAPDGSSWLVAGAWRTKITADDAKVLQFVGTPRQGVDTQFWQLIERTIVDTNTAKLAAWNSQLIRSKLGA